MKTSYALRMAAAFGLAQMLMPILGWIGGRQAYEYIKSFDHWLAFGILTFIGLKMIYESIKLKDQERVDRPMNTRLLLALAVATSIDALAVGFSISLLNITIIAPAVVIGVITFLMTFSGVYIGNRCGHLFENKIEIIGGLILIGIGTRILLQHL